MADGGGMGEDRGAAGGIVGGPLLEGAGNGADAAGDTSRDEFGDQIEQQFSVGEAFRGGPVRGVNLFFDAGAMEAAVGKSVDREDVTIVLMAAWWPRRSPMA